MEKQKIYLEQQRKKDKQIYTTEIAELKIQIQHLTTKISEINEEWESKF